MLRRSLVVVSLLLLSTTTHADSIVINFTIFGLPDGVFNYTVPAGQIVTGVNVSGSFNILNNEGPPGRGLTAGLLIEGLHVYVSQPVPRGGSLNETFSYTFAPDAGTLAPFDDGMASYRGQGFLSMLVRAVGTITITTGDTRPPAPAPEPATVLLLLTGLAAIVVRRVRTSRRPSPVRRRECG